MSIYSHYNASTFSEETRKKKINRFRDFLEKVHFGPFLPNLGQNDNFLLKSDYIILKVLSYSIFMQIITRNGQMVQKI